MTVEEWNKQDRQWPRHLRLDHDRYQKRVAKDDATRKFWSDVIRSNQLSSSE